MYDRLNQREITNPYLLTPKAIKILQGKTVTNISPDDWESFHQYCERLAIVDSIVNNVFNHFKLS